MTVESRLLGRRERNKLDKLARITAAAGELFAERGVDEVTTQEIADRADIGAGTLFLYAKSKGELLLLVQNSTYAGALEQGRADARKRLVASLVPIRGFAFRWTRADGWLVDRIAHTGVCGPD